MAFKQIEIKPLNLTQQSKKDVQKLASIQNSLTSLTKQFVNKDIDIITNETSKISKFAEGLNSILQKITQYKTECQKTTRQLQNQVGDLQNKIKTYERDVKTNNKENEYKKQIQNNQKLYLSQWQKRIGVASKINTDPFLKVEIEDKKSKAHEIFKWVIISIYGEPQNKYYWPNFKEQIFKRDQGVDFKQRLGKINASNAKQQQRIKTVDLLKNWKQVQASPELKKVQNQIEQIRKVAQIFLSCFQLSRKIKDLQRAIQKSKQQSRQRDQQAMRWKARAQALGDRIITNKQYLVILNKIQIRLKNKVGTYSQKEILANEIIEKLNRSQILPQITGVEIQKETRQNCQCSLW